MRFWKTKALSIGLVSLVLSTTLLVNLAFAAASGTSKETLDKYLSALQKQDINSAVALSIDKRCNGDADEEVSLKGILSDPNQQIKDYKILDTELQKDGYKILLANVTFNNNKVCQIPFKLESISSSWQVIISSELVDSSLYKTIEEGKEIINTEKTNKDSIVSPLLSPYLARWYNLHLGGSQHNDVYYTSTFDVTSTYVTLNLQQENVMYQQKAHVNYAIVTKGVFADQEWGSVSLNKNITSSHWETIKCESHNGVCLRLRNIAGAENIDGENVFGEVYNGTP